MTPYSFALTVFHLVAVGLVLQLAYSSVVYRVLLVSDLGSGAHTLQVNVPHMTGLEQQIVEAQNQSAEMQHQILVRGALLEVGAAVFLYFLAPLLARIVTFGHNDRGAFN